MSTKAVSPLRRRMIKDMVIRQFGEHTKRDHIRQIREFTAFLGRSPDWAEPEDPRRYQLHLPSPGSATRPRQRPPSARRQARPTPTSPPRRTASPQTRPHQDSREVARKRRLALTF